MKFIDSLLYVALFNFLFGGYIFAKNFRSAKNISFALLCFGIGTWVGGFWMINALREFYWPNMAILFGGILTAGSFFVFTNVFPSELTHYAKLKNNMKLLELLPLAALTLMLPFNLFIKDVVFINQQPIPSNASLFWLYAVVLCVYAIFICRNFYLQFKNSIGYKRQQILYFLLGLVLFITLSIIFDLILPAFNYFKFQLAGPFSSLIFTPITALSIVSLRLMDIRLFTRAVFTNSIGFLAALFSVVLYRDLIEKRSVHLETILLITLSMLVIFLIIRYFLQKLYKKLFLKGYEDFNRNIEMLNLKLRQELKTENIIRLVSDHLKKALALPWVYFYDLDQPKIYFDSESHTKRKKPGYKGKEINLSEQASSAAIIKFAQKFSQPYFFGGPQFGSPENYRAIEAEASELNLAIGQIPSAILPLQDREKNLAKGFFILGPQLGLSSGLSIEEIHAIQTCWAHIQTAFARAMLYDSLESRVRAQVESIIYKNRRLREEINNRMEFVRSTSHQLRTPITALSGALQLLVSSQTATGMSAEQKELSELAYDKAKSLAELVSDILSLTKIEKNNSSAKDLVDLNQIFSRILPVLQPIINSKDLALDYQAANQPLKVFGSSSYLEQAFFNILENAVNYTKKGGIRIYFRVEPEHIITCIADSGTGVEDNIREKVFKKNLHNPKSGGSGLGLYLVKTIIDAHPKGHVWFDSSKNGTTFFVRLQRA